MSEKSDRFRNWGKRIEPQVFSHWYMPSSLRMEAMFLIPLAPSWASSFVPGTQHASPLFLPNARCPQHSHRYREGKGMRPWRQSVLDLTTPSLIPHGLPSTSGDIQESRVKCGIEIRKVSFQKGGREQILPSERPCKRWSLLVGSCE